jgi:hypothetical protein
VREQGTLVEVVDEPQGSSLTADVLSGVTVLPVKDLSDFETDGTCRINDVDYAYVVTEGPDPDDDSDDTFTITPGLAAAASEGDVVAAVNAQGAVESVLLARVDLEFDDSSDPVEAVIRTGDRAYFPPGDVAAGALVDVESTRNGYEAVSRPYDPSQLDASVVQSPAIEMYLAADTANFTTGAWTPVTGWSVSAINIFDPPDASGWVAIPMGGRYLLVATHLWEVNSSGSRYSSFNGLDIGGVESGVSPVFRHDPTGIATSLLAVHPVYLAEGTKIRSMAQQSSGAGLKLTGNGVGTFTTFAITYLGP